MFLENNEAFFEFRFQRNKNIIYTRDADTNFYDQNRLSMRLLMQNVIRHLLEIWSALKRARRRQFIYKKRIVKKKKNEEKEWKKGEKIMEQIEWNCSFHRFAFILSSLLLSPRRILSRYRRWRKWIFIYDHVREYMLTPRQNIGGW